MNVMTQPPAPMEMDDPRFDTGVNPGLPGVLGEIQNGAHDLAEVQTGAATDPELPKRIGMFVLSESGSKATFDTDHAEAWAQDVNVDAEVDRLSAAGEVSDAAARGIQFERDYADGNVKLQEIKDRYNANNAVAAAQVQHKATGIALNKAEDRVLKAEQARLAEEQHRQQGDLFAGLLDTETSDEDDDNTTAKVYRLDDYRNRKAARSQQSQPNRKIA